MSANISPNPISNLYPSEPTPAGANVDRLQAWLDNQLSDADDTVFVTREGDDMYKIDVNGESEYVNGEELKKLKFDLKGGKDTMVVGEGVPIDITAELGEGDDRFWGGGGNDNVKGGNGNDKIYGRGGNDHMNGGAGNDEIWGLMGHNTMIGGAGSDVFMTGAVSQNLVDFTGGEDSLPTATTAPNSTTTATPRNTTQPAASTTTPATSTATPAGTTTPTAGATSTTGNGSTIINGNGNTVYINSAPTGTGTATGSSVSKGDFTLAKVMGTMLGSGYTKSPTGTYVKVDTDQTIEWSQPGGAGSPIRVTYTDTSGEYKGTVKVIELTADGKGDVVSYNNPKLSAADNEKIKNAMMDGDYLAKQLDLVMGGDSKMKKKGAHGNTSASGASGSASGSGDADATGTTGDTGDTGSVSGSGDDYSGLNVDGTNDGSGSWFLVLAEGMGKIMNTFAKKMIELLNQIEAAGDDPPYELTAKFQATSQQLAFMQQAFMTALNSLGESIKTGVTAGGAAR
jgi:RTX calcium-binding nonapeptide repeat (4 copies)